MRHLYLPQQWSNLCYSGRIYVTTVICSPAVLKQCNTHIILLYDIKSSKIRSQRLTYFFDIQSWPLSKQKSKSQLWAFRRSERTLSCSCSAMQTIVGSVFDACPVEDQSFRRRRRRRGGVSSRSPDHRHHRHLTLAPDQKKPLNLLSTNNIRSGLFFISIRFKATPFFKLISFLLFTTCRKIVKSHRK